LTGHILGRGRKCWPAPMRQGLGLTRARKQCCRRHNRT